MNDAPAAPPRPRHSIGALARSAGLVTLIRGVDFGLSFLVSVLLANRFGASGQLDAFFLARRTTVGFADTIRKLIGQIVLPPVIAAIDRGEPPSLRLLPRRLRWFLFAFAGVMAAGMLAPGLWVNLFAPGFSGERHTLTEAMLRIMLPLLPIAVVASLLAALLQARRRYLLSEGTNLVQRAILVAVLAFAVPPLGIVAGAWTMLGSGVVGLAILFAGAWGLLREGHGAPVATAEAVPQKGGGLLAAVILNGYFQATALLDFAFASMTGDGGVAALEYGARLVSLVPGLILSSLYTVMLPELIRAVQVPDRTAAAAGIDRYQRLALFAQLPVSVGMMLGAEIMVRALFGHGAFDERSIAMAAAATAGYAAAGIFLAPMTAVTSAIYADPFRSCLRHLTIIAVIGIGVRVAMLAVAAPTWGAGGIAWAAAAATALAAIVTQMVAIRRFPALAVGAQLIEFARLALCAGVAALAGAGVLAAVPASGSVVVDLLQLAMLGAAVVVAFVAMATVLHVPELTAARTAIATVLAKRRRKR